ncbi:adenylosuccinate lyase / hypoxanthine phosphoribosyltransferase (fusion) [Mycoplasma haemofelis str. Langford 1]|uniref:Adenylosuccinate lyase / hypoxanthine phosphoribosyltransferase (Fusion) n=1 Tax=Mycoplasma haemofelis (strain Langford 1) TaxID=941640 RepID=E8ZKC9_MYCHL|nr:lyase family protein [Mycoplasma haemofelis]CBY92095.1 adenylosuccinate lyase / hypoxanthine phosphoribosyltransferase (fusion) [Mycoplasma haemofelis str. Langford 1]
MIRRYRIKKLEDIFSDDNKFGKWLDIESLLLKYLWKKGKFSQEVRDSLISSFYISKNRISEEERRTKHDVSAFINTLCECSPLPERKWIHYGLTSSDVVDTANSLMLREANECLLDHIYSFRDALQTLAFKYKSTLQYDRKEKYITSFGYKFALFFNSLNELLSDFKNIRSQIECASFSGSVGTYAHIDMDFQEFAARELNLFSATSSNQVISRTRYYSYFSLLSSIGLLIEELAMELRHLSRTEIAEISEGFEELQIGSSSMPHKKNPITLENICGLVRLLKGYSYSSSLNSAIWLERDISHSSVDRVLFLDATTVLCQIAMRMTKVLENMSVNEVQINSNIRKNKDDLYKRIAFKTLCEKSEYHPDQVKHWIEELSELSQKYHSSFENMFRKSNMPNLLKEEEVENIFDLSYRISHLDEMYSKIFRTHMGKERLSEVLYEKEDIEFAISKIANFLNVEYREDEEVELFGCGEESIMFLSKLTPHLHFKFNLQWITENSEKGDLKEVFKDTGDKKCLFLTALIETGSNIRGPYQFLKRYRPRDVKICTLFFKHSPKAREVPIDFFGLFLPSKEFVGFGVGWEHGLGNLSCVGIPKIIKI